MCDAVDAEKALRQFGASHSTQHDELINLPLQLAFLLLDVCAIDSQSASLYSVTQLRHLWMLLLV